MTDGFGNYVPGLTHPDPADLGGGSVLFGYGAPDNSLGMNGDLYVNKSNGDIYSKNNDAWELQGGGGASVSNTISTGSPIGVATPTAIGQFYTDTDGPTVWQAIGLTNADWTQIT